MVAPRSSKFKSKGKKRFTFPPVSTKAPGCALPGLACVMPCPRQSPWPTGWSSLCDKAWVRRAFLKLNVTRMTESGNGMAPQREKEVLVPEDGQMLAWQTKTIEMHCDIFFNGVSLLPY